MSDYKMIGKIYESNNSLVYRAMLKGENRPIILKILKQDYPTPSELTRYKQEYEIIRSLNLDGVIKVYELQRYENTLAMIVEDFGGESLKKLMTQREFPLEELLKMAIKVAESLGEIHRANIIHKDINPSNIVYKPATGELKLIDFGIATVLSQENPSIRNPNYIEGTLDYISPEQTGRMNRAIDYRSDFYSLGATLYELLTQKLPFESTDAMELVHCHIAKEPVPPQAHRSIPETVSRIVMKLMAKTAEERYQSAWGLKADLETCLDRLQTNGEIADFPLGSRDISEKFAIPQKLYGREAEVEQLLATFARVSAGTRSMMLVAGYSGIGKSALINEIHKPIVAARGYFISGKFDQFKRDIPYSALLQAFQELMRQLLSESEVQLAAWKQKLLSALGRNGQVLVDVIPEVELIIGKQPPVPQLGPTESQNRFNVVFQQFIDVFAQKSHPLALFLDDLQWADAASLKLLELLMSDRERQYLLAIGAYRDNEVSATHPLTVTIEQIQKAGGRVDRIVLKPLQVDQVNQLIADTLSCPSAESKPLAELVFEKTNGNPFFLTQLLQSLYGENLLSFDSSKGRWQWDIQQMQAVGITDNVVELTLGNIEKLEPQTQNALKLAACIGNRFDLEILSIVNGKSPVITADALWPALQQGLIVPMSDAYKQVMLRNQEVEDVNNSEISPSAILYKFLHDRVQQAAYALIPAERQKEVHLQVGQLLLKNTPPEKLEENIFEIVNQLNIGAELIRDRSLKNKLSRLNLVAGQKAKAAAAYKAAVKYLNAGLELLSSDSWQHQYDLTLNLHVETVESEYLTAQFERAEQLAVVVLQKAKNILDKVKVYEIKIQSYRSQLQVQPAIDTALEILAQLGVVLPPQPSQENMEEAQKTLEVLLKDKQIEDLANLPEMTAPDKLAAVRILLAIASPAYIANTSLFIMVAHSLVNLCLKYGNSSMAPGGYVLYALYLAGVKEELNHAYQFGKLSLSLLDKYDSRQLKTLLLHVFNNHIKHWKDPIIEGIELARETVQNGIENGNLEYCSYSAITYCLHLLFAGGKLEILERDSAKYKDLMIKYKQQYSTGGLRLSNQAALNLQLSSLNKQNLIGEVFDETKECQIYEQTKNYTFLVCFNMTKAILSYIFKDYSQGLSNSRKGIKYESYAAGMIVVSQNIFYNSLSILALYSHGDLNKQKKYIKQVAANQKRIKKWAEHAPVNYQNKCDLVVAETARVLGKTARAREYYDRAIEGAKKNEFLHEEAISYERAAEFYFSIGREEVGQLYMRNAHHCYSRWGAAAKVSDLEAEYPQIFARGSGTNQTGNHSTISTTSTTGSSSGEVLDLGTVLKASQAISGEIVLDKLLASLMKIVIENAGAQKGFLLLPYQVESGESKWVIEVEGTVDGSQVTTARSILLESASGSLLSEGIINYVTRSQENVVLSDATNEGQFTKDPYIAAKQPKSILCTPLVNQGKLAGILYLENNLTTGAFTPDRLEVLQLLSSQAAISIENAKLYNQLEVKVEERTAQLAAATEEAQAANKAKSTFIANMSHELRSPLNAILGFSQLTIRSSGLSKEQAENLGIVSRSGEHLLSLIDNVLDLSKIESGKTTLNEKNFDLYRLLDDIEDMFHLKASDKGLQLVCDRASEVPRYIRTDQVKLRQVLINLLNNALKFTAEGGVSVRTRLADVPRQSQGTREEQNTEKIAIHFEIEDTGAGIAEEELGSLFKAFEQTSTGKQAQEGTGLGLPISRQFVQLMGGDLLVSSQVGKGTVFYFDIVVKEAEATEIQSSKPSRQVIALEPNQPRYRILIVDDQAMNRQLLIKQLNPLGFELKEATNGKEAVELFAEWSPDLVWMDMRMPVMDGYEATRQIKAMAKGESPKIIALTASVLEEEKAVVMEAGCDDYLRKPYREKDIWEMMGFHIGVRYVYSRVEEPEKPETSASEKEVLTAAAMAALPSEWLESLSEAILEGDIESMATIIDRISTQNAPLASVLKACVEKFEYDNIFTYIPEEIKN